MKLRYLIPVACTMLVSGLTQSAPLEIQLPPETAQLKPSNHPGRVIASQKCAICHSVDYINLQPGTMSLKQWTAEVTKMQRAYGAPIDEAEIAQISAFLATTYGTEPAGTVTTASAASAPAGSAKATDAMSLLNANACLGCHAIQNKIVGPAYQDVAKHYKDDAQALSKVSANIRQGGSGRWGAVPMPGYAGLSDEEIHTLAAFILKQ
ncbi:c-type cytochrome [Undibacterium jejuense]|uniref:C-type cytochrome n=1 Tax=Undibacterium jejuense TaxID=1344949 RepID=A0A923HPW9_9BURK|nr:c-type cytochrome [Undibacterium jejuense]MBC3862568.1 c-type cytochrome [Undibacterium jejuense]